MVRGLALSVWWGVAVGCTDGPADADIGPYRIRVLDGDGQTGLIGASLPDPLRVEVRQRESGAAVAGVPVDWSVTSGSGSLANRVTSTDASGVAAVRLTLGEVEGEVRISARTPGASGTAGFRALASAQPRLEGTESPLVAGQVAGILGAGFVPDPEAYVITFSGVPGELLSVEPNRLRVRVPDCLPTRSVTVRALVGGQASNPLVANVTGSGDTLFLEVGEDLLLTGAPDLRCRHVGFRAGESYLLAVQSVATGTTASHAWGLLGLGERGEPTTSAPLTRPTGPVAARGPAIDPLSLRLPAVQAPTPGGAAPGPSGGVWVSTPSIGDTARFRVLDGTGGFEDVTGRLRVVSARAEVYVDVRAPAPGFSDPDLSELAVEFDAVVYPTVEGAFGAPSDLDGNGRIQILFSPAVNRLAPRESGAFVAGFFYAADLAPADGTPPAERFYAAVPDSAGLHADPVDRDFLLDALPPVLAHEFQHMVHHHHRVLLGGATRVEALWLQEALAQMAEDLVAETLEEGGDADRAAIYRAGVYDRASRYLADADNVSVVATTGIGTLAERGAGWLFARYVTDHLGGAAVLRAMTNSTALGIETVVEATGEPWSRTFSDFTLALYLDTVGGLPPRFGFPSHDLDVVLAGSGGTAPSSPESLRGEGFLREGSLRAASARTFILTPEDGGALALTLTGGGDGASLGGPDIRLRVVRYR